MKLPTLPHWLERLTETGYSRLRSGEEKENDRRKRNGEGGQGIVSRVRDAVSGSSLLVRIGVSVMVVVVLMILSHSIFLKKTNHYTSPTSTDARYLHVLIPATSPDPNLCKTLVSASVLRYPVPTLINYGQNFSDAAGDRMQKIPGVLSYLSTLHSSRDQDLVLMVDGYDVWFQLRPETLLERYFAINSDADARLLARLGKQAVEAEGLKQSIVFSAQKKCYPRDEDDPACFAAPESTLPPDVYGPETDRAVPNDENPFIKFRPRFLNSGIMMGEVGAVRKLFTRALQLMEELDPQQQGSNSDQSIFAQIWGQQEFQREVIRERHLTTSQRLGRKLKALLGMPAAPSILAPHPTHRLMATVEEGTPFEYGVGLDYASQLGHPTVFAEYDSEWVAYNDGGEAIAVASRKLGITPPRAGELPDDIARSLPPFWTQNPLEDGLPLASEEEGEEEVVVPWSNLTLLTNLWTGTVPALIHHNAHINGLKSQRTEAWPKIWFQPYARELLDANVREPYRPFAVTRTRGGRETAWWGRENRKWETHVGGVEKEKAWISWEGLCGGVGGAEEEVFRDGRGAWRPPRFDY